MGQVFVVVRNESKFERIHEVCSGESFIGRGTDCEICLSHPLVSRKHAVIVKTEAGCVIRDLKSLNGTRIGRRQIHNDVKLADGFHIQIGSYGLQVCSSLASAKMEENGDNDSTQSARLMASGADASSFEQHSLTNALTPAQQRVVDLLAQGLIEKEVARRFGVTSHTVHDHVKAIYKALSVSTRGELISRWATRHG